jgi:transcriptional regulator NrdR family protein
MMSGKLKCPECGAWTEILETKQIRNTNTIRRRRECGNGHRLTTHETFVKMIQNEKTTLANDKRTPQKQT